MENLKSAEDGVNLEEGDSFSEYCARLCRETYENSPFIEVRDFSRGHFRGPRGFRLRYHPRDFYMDLAMDGDGTKPVIIDSSGDFSHAGDSIVAMTCTDITRWGGKPVLIVDQLDAKTIGKKGDDVNDAFRKILLSLKYRCDIEWLVLYKGETAEMGPCISSDNPRAGAIYVWCGVAFGMYNPDTIITGDQIQKGMIVMALRERGFRNNGISTLRAALKSHYGEDVYSNPDPEIRKVIKEAATPAALYDRFLTYLNGWNSSNFEPVIKMFSIIHVTGGAIKSKFARDILFPRGLSCDLFDFWDPPELMAKCAEWRGLTDEEFYNIWHGGQGVLCVINRADEGHFLRIAERFGIEAKVAGEITRDFKTPTLFIKSKLTGKTFSYRSKE